MHYENTPLPAPLGFGLGLRTPHYQDILSGDPDIDWFEIISENFMIPGGRPMRILEEIRARYPIVMHGVSMSIASTAPLNMDYLRDLKALADRIEPRWISDHVCWTGVHGVNMHDLLPFPYTKEALDHVTDRVMQVQDFLGQPLTLENASAYISYRDSEIPEWDFIAEVVKRTGCWLLLDINNIYVSSVDQGFDPNTFMEAVPVDCVVQFHLAGHSYDADGKTIIDTHDHEVCDDVWSLYAKALKRFGPVSTMIERDDNIPALSEVLVELQQARDIAAKVLGTATPEKTLEAAG